MILATHGIVSSSGGLPPSTLLTNLYAVYKAENNANDSLGIYNGTAQGGLTYTTGKSGDAFTFNGTNAYVSLPNNSLNLSGDFSISIWVYCATGGIQSILCNDYYIASPNTEKGWVLGIDNSGGTSRYVNFTIIKGTSTTYSNWSFNTTALTASAWNHIILTRVSGINTYCWVNGVSQSYTLTGTGADITFDPIYNTTQYCAIGADKYASASVANYMKNTSRIDELNIWNKELTSTEITDLYNSGAGKFYPTF